MNARTCCISLLAATLASFPATAQQPPVTYRFHSAARTGAAIGKYALTSDVEIEGLAVNSNGDVALVVSHIPMGKSFGSAVVTPDRVIASTFDHISGTRTLLDISGLPLAIDDQRHVVYESSFQDGETTKLGIFKDKELQFEVNGPGAADDFTVAPDGKITPKAGIVAIQATPTASQPAAAPRNPAQQQSNGLPGIFNNSAMSQQMRAKIAQRYGIVLPPNPLALPPQQPQQPRPPQPAQEAPRAATPNAQPARPAAACTLPAAFPLPADWIVGGAAKGPITSNLFDAPGAKPRSYESPFYGHEGSAFRTVLYSADCAPQLVVIGDSALHGKFEFWTPNGLLTFTRPDGYLELPGFTGKALANSLARRDALIRVSPRGTIALEVNLDPEGYAILLATPTGR